MAKHIRIKKHGIKGFWIISYLIVFLIPIMVSLIAVTVFYGNYEKQIGERNDIVLHSVCNTVDAHLEDIVDSSFQLSNNDYIKKIDSFSLPLSATQDYTLYEFTTEFKNIRGYETVENYSDTFFVYFSSIDYVVGSGYAIPAENFYPGHINGKKFSMSDWKEFLTKEYEGEFFSGKLFTDENELLFARTHRLGYNENSYITAVYKINTDKVIEEAQSLYHYEYGTFSLSDSDGNVIVKSGAEKRLPSDDVSFEVESEVTGWKYTYSLPKDKAYGNVYNVFVVVLIMYLLCVVAGLWIIRYFIQRNYKPIDNLMTLFRKEDAESKSDEFSYLNEKITESLSHNIELNQEIDSQNKMIREHLLSEILIGHSPVGKRSKTELEKLQFNVEEDEFTVLMYSLGSEDTEELSMKQFVLCNVTDELLTNKDCRFASTKKEEDIVYIICKTMDIAEEIEEIVTFLMSFTKKEFEFEFYAALGGVGSGIGGISASFNEAKRALDYSVASGTIGFVKYDEVSTSLKDSYFYSVELESRLVNLLKANEQKKVKTLLDEIFSSNIGEGVSLDSVRYLITELFSTVNRLMMQYGHKLETKYPDEAEFIENIFEVRDVQKMKDAVYSVYSKCGRDVFGVPVHKDDLIGGIMRYVNQNYSNQNLGIRLIGEAFSMNADYLSRKFRENTGKTINDYIRDIRIEKAKLLLKESDELIADIAEMVGFTSYRTFVRVFTEVVGVNPNKYKTMK